MAFLLILLALFGFALASFGSSSSSSGTVTLAPKCAQRAGAEATSPHCPPPANP
jgi:hypothetical protein